MSSTAAHFATASTQYLQGPTSGFGDTDWTVAGWFYCDSNTDGAIVAKDGDGGVSSANRCFGFFYDSASGKINLDIHRSGTTVSVFSVETVVIGTWNFFAIEHDSVNDLFYVKLNGAAAVSAATGGSINGGTAPVCIANRSYAGSGLPFDGAIQLVSWHTRVLAGYELNLLRNRGFGRFYSGIIDGLLTNLEAFWALNETSGNRLDSTANAHDLTPINTPTTATGIPTNLPSGDASYNGGPGSKNFADNAQDGAGGVGNTRTFINADPQSRLLQNGTITSVKYLMHAAPPTIKIKVFRPNGSNFDFVGESEAFAPTSGSTQTHTLSTPITGVQPGDILGLWCNNDGTDANWVAVKTASGTGTIRYQLGDETGTNVNFAGSQDSFLLNLEAFGAAPIAGMCGDSIECGHGSSYNSFMDGTGPAGDISAELGYRMRQILGSGFTYQDYAAGSKEWSWVLSTGVPAMQTGAGAHQSGELMNSEYWFHCGVNDVSAGRTWAAIESDLNEIYGLCGAAKVFIDEILPWTNGNDTQAATIRTFNVNLNAWKVGKSNVRIVPVWSATGQLRVSTGSNDDLISGYDADGVHPNATGAAEIAMVRQNAQLASIVFVPSVSGVRWGARRGRVVGY